MNTRTAQLAGLVRRQSGTDIIQQAVNNQSQATAGVIAGSIVGALAFIVACATVVFIMLRRHKRQQKLDQDNAKMQSAYTATYLNGQPDSSTQYSHNDAIVSTAPYERETSARDSESHIPGSRIPPVSPSVSFPNNAARQNPV